ncbi:Rid family detoxifying hydrolase [bacterium]|nr:Rid family detoxifying hydrolase [bacterium]
MNEFAKVAIDVSTAPKAIGPYSQAIKSGNLVFLSMQIALDPKSGEMVGGADVAAQAKRVLQNIEAILDASSSAMARILRCTIYFADLADYEAVNKIYAEYFPYEPPARSAIQVAGLPRGARVGIDVIATCKIEESQFGGSKF